jgi:hypothetical protein
MARFPATEQAYARKFHELVDRTFLGGRSDLGNELLELMIGAEFPQIVVGHQAIGIFISAADGLTQILQGVIGAVGSCCYAGEAIPSRPAASVLPVIVPFSITS